MVMNKYITHYKIFMFLVFILFYNFLFAQSPAPVSPAYPTNIILNSVKSFSPHKPIVNEADVFSGLRQLTEVTQISQYSDGFGRGLEIVSKDGSPAGNDMVSPYYYDPTTGIPVLQYLPFTSNVATSGDIINDGSFKLDCFQQQVAFYNTYLSGQANETNVGTGGSNWAYALTNFESSPLYRVMNTFQPGVSWVGSQNASKQHNVQEEYLVDTTVDNVKIWNISAWTVSNPEVSIIPTSNGTYGTGQLTKLITTDEQGSQNIIFKDKYGQIILKKTQISSITPLDPGTGSGYTGWLCTYYVYDDHGNMRFIITPNVVAQMFAANSWVVSQTQADELCYRFEYDQSGHLVVKKTPGTPTGTQGEIWMVYDERNRLVMEQDGNLRGAEKWQYIQYDNLDRPIAKGFIYDPSNFNQLSYHITNAATSANNSSGVSAWPILSNYSTTELLAQTFYDNYASIPATLSQTADASVNGTGNTTAFTTSYNVSPNYAQPITQSPMTQGLVTGTNVEVLGSNGGQYISSVSFYDEKSRIIQSQSINYTKGKDIITSQYSWDGKLLSSLTYHNYSSTINPQTHSEITSMSYYPAGRLNTISKTVNSIINGIAVSSPSTIITTYNYDELGRLLTNVLGNSMETLTYGYNVRGWLLGINNAFISGSGSNYFGEEIGYDKSNSLAPGNAYITPVFNGNIAGSVWKSKGDGINRKYDFTYDNVNRLLSAVFLQNSTGSAWDKTFIDFSVSGLSYDANGNIGALIQNGFAQSGVTPVDNLSYNYLNGAGNSNRLQYVYDGVNVTNSTLGDFHYPGGAKTGSTVDYNYDANANTVSDNNRSIAGISYYSCFNLPNTISTAKGTIQYIYDAAGNKLSKIVTENNVVIKSIMVNNSLFTNITTNIITTTKYINGFVYKTINYTNASLTPLNNPNTDVLQFISDENGRLRFKPAVGAVAASFVHDYFIHDHLGNVRVGITDESQQDIYPAATGETTGQNGGIPQTYEALYYSFNSSDFVSTSNLPSWFANMPGSGYMNENGNGTPTNLVDPYSIVTNTSAKVFQLCGNTANNPTGDNFGLGITLKVMSGDQINIYGLSFWHNTGNLPTGAYPVSSVISSLLSSFGNSGAVLSTTSHSALDGSAFNTSSTMPSSSLLSPLLNNSSNQPGTQAPYAGINYIIFDDQFRPVSVGIDLVSTTTDNIKNHSLSVSIPKNGYIYVYVSNQSNINVYFDNLQLVQTRGPLLEEMHYYPSGLMMAGITDKAWNKGQNYFHYQGKEMQNQEWNDGSGLEEYDFASRYYDPQLGRWNTQDLASQYASPYVGMGNKWPNGIDPNGKNFWSTLGTIGLIAGSAIAAYFTAGLSFDAESQFIIAGAVAAGGYAGASLESGNNWNPGKWNNNAWKGAITGELITASVAIGGEYAAGEFADLSTGSLADIASIETGAATGVGQNIAMTEAGSVISTGKLSWNWDDMFVATTTGAISGVFQSPGMQKLVDNDIWGGVSNHDLQGVTSNVIGGVLSTAIKGADKKGWRGIFDISDQWPNALGNAAGQVSHQFLTTDAYSFWYTNIGGSFTKKFLSNYANSFMQQGFANVYPFDITNIMNNSFWNTTQGWTIDSLFPNVY
jgi:RHS repeat-associated protein